MNLKFNGFLFFNKNEVGSKSILLKKYGVKKNSYAGNVLARIYDQYFGNSIEIKKEYKRYYKKEFRDYVQYLVCRFNMPETLAIKISEEKKYYVNLNWKEEQPGSRFSYDDDLRKQFWDFVGGLEDES